MDKKAYLFKAAFTSLSLFGLFFIIYLLFNFTNQPDYESTSGAHYSHTQMMEFALKNLLTSNFPSRTVTFSQIQEDPDENGFILDGNDAIVFLHIQKTAGTSFERFLVKKLKKAPPPCVCSTEGKKRCDCRAPNGRIWLFSRYSTGWVDWACGLHTDYTQIASGCVDYYFEKKEGRRKNRLFLTTFLREPIERFISEYSHVQRGATWKRSRHFCNGRAPTSEELPLCYDPQLGWEGVELDEFLGCPYNLAFNRQTRMLADLTLVNCYNHSTFKKDIVEKMMLESAKRNLKNFAFFGLKEWMNESQLIFENTFGLRFDGSLAEWNKSKSSHIFVSPEQLVLIRQKNQLDLALYQFAKELFERRLLALGWNTSSMHN